MTNIVSVHYRKHSSDITQPLAIYYRTIPPSRSRLTQWQPTETPDAGSIRKHYLTLLPSSRPLCLWMPYHGFFLMLYYKIISSCSRLYNPANPSETGLLLPSSDNQATQTDAAAFTAEAELILPRIRAIFVDWNKYFSLCAPGSQQLNT